MNLVIATVRDWGNMCVKHNDMILWLHRQHDNFPGWGQPEGKVEPCESFFEAALWELKEEIGLTALNLQLKGISSFIKPDKKRVLCLLRLYMWILWRRATDRVAWGTPKMACHSRLRHAGYAKRYPWTFPSYQLMLVEHEVTTSSHHYLELCRHDENHGQHT